MPGMDGVAVLFQTVEDGQCWVLVEAKERLVGCRSCGVRATGHGRCEVQLRDLPTGVRPVCLVWRKRRWICLDPESPSNANSRVGG